MNECVAHGPSLNASKAWSDGIPRWHGVLKVDPIDPSNNPRRMAYKIITMG